MKNTTHTLVAIISLTGFVGGFAGVASAGIEQSPTHGGLVVSDASDSLQTSIADNFIVGTGGESLKTLTWWGGYTPDNLPANDSFTINIYRDLGGIPDVGQAPEFSRHGITADSRTATSVVLFGSIDEYKYTLDLNGLHLDSGTYWLEIFNDTPQSSANWSWETGHLDSVNGRARSAAVFRNLGGEDWFGNGPELAFSFTNVPAPGSLALLGLAGCASTQRRRS